MRLVRLAFRFLWDRHEAEDAVQDALFTAHRQADQLREQDKWWGWLCRIVVHRCLRSGRDRRRSIPLSEDLDVADGRRENTQHQASTERKQAVRLLMAELPRRQREVIVLRHLEGLSFERIGELLGVTQATARVHAMAGRERLRTLMLERHPGLLGGRSPAKGEEA